MLGLSKKKSTPFPIPITDDAVTYAHEQSKVYLEFPFVGWFGTQFRTEWEDALNRTPTGENFLGNIRHRVVHSYEDLAKIQTAMRDLEEARHMAYAISLVYAAIFYALDKQLPYLVINMLDDYVGKPKNLGMLAANRFFNKLDLLNEDLGYKTQFHITRSGGRSRGTAYAKAFIEVLLNEIESLANEAEMNQ